MIGEVVGNYRIMDKIATGGMGVVYHAEHNLIGKKAAIKVLKKQFSANRDVVDRFFNEARGTTSISHPGIVDIYDFGYYHDDRAYIVMEFLEGETLKARMASDRPRMSHEAAIRIVHNVAGAVGAAHERGIIHRDLKPDNIFLVPDADMPGGERVKVLDFGLAKLTEEQSASMGTQAGIVLGTPTYMAPEQCDGLGVIDHRADQYALGCILFQAACGRPPFSSKRPYELLQAHRFEAPPVPSSLNSTVPAGIEHVILKLLAKNPDDRYLHMDALRFALDQCKSLVDDSAATVRHLRGTTNAETAPWTPEASHDSRRLSTQMPSAPRDSRRLSTQMPSAHDGNTPAPVTFTAVRAAAESGGHTPRVTPSGISTVRPPSITGIKPETRSPLTLALWVVGGIVSIMLGLGLAYAVTLFMDEPPQTIIPENQAIPEDEPELQAGPSVGDEEVIEFEPDEGVYGVEFVDGGIEDEESEPGADDEVDERGGIGGDGSGSEDQAGSASIPDDSADDSAADSAADSADDSSDDSAADAEASADAEPASIAAGEAAVRVRITLRGLPPDAVVTVDGIEQKKRPLILEPRSRLYRIEASAPGYESKLIRVRADRDRIVPIVLARKSAVLDL